MTARLFLGLACSLTLPPSLALARKKPTPTPAAPAAPGAADWRTPDPDNVLVIDTTKGRIIVELAPAAAPLASARVRALAHSGFYDGRAFFRVIDGFMDQTGDPQDTGMGGSTQPDLPAEFTFRRGADTPLIIVDKSGGTEQGFLGSLPVVSQSLDLGVLTADHKVSAWGAFCPGVVGMARADDPASANSQFFLMRGAQRSLDQQYTAIGRVIAGQDVVNAIKTGEPVVPPQDRMTKVQVLADIPAAQRPTVRVIDPAGPWFQAAVARAKAEKVVSFSVCDVPLPAQVSPS
ncbi:MAG TPA: peptidylprolyl isomerase [Caulobacteraceae bacterium]|nr:peptidylprolyl isomerase [Caulobacteraceae bacterium]